EPGAIGYYLGDLASRHAIAWPKRVVRVAAHDMPASQAADEWIEGIRRGHVGKLHRADGGRWGGGVAITGGEGRGGDRRGGCAARSGSWRAAYLPHEGKL